VLLVLCFLLSTWLSLVVVVVVVTLEVAVELVDTAHQ
jgi:hypothetical protein